MPLRNILWLIGACAFSVACYVKAPGNYYATQMAQAMRLISNEALQPTEPEKLFENAMQGMLTGLDPYSRYLPPEQFQPLQEDLDQEFGGIGVIVEQDPETKQLVILSPSAGSPAQRAGIRAGDVIMSIDGESTEKFSMADTVDRIRGKPGTAVQLGLKRADSDEIQQFKLVREIIAVPSVLGDTRNERGEWQFVLADQPRIGYLRIDTFGEQTVEELESALQSIVGEVDGLIVDLRNNAGGLLSAAVGTCDLFLSGGDIVMTRERGGTIRDRYTAQPGTLFPLDTPIVVLVNRYSASASEIVAACLQDHGRAVVVGERSWGKGTVQNIYPFEAGRSALKLTVAKYSRPSGANIHRTEGMDEKEVWGVKPNSGLEVRLSDEEFAAVFEQRRRRDLAAPTAHNPEGGEAQPVHRDTQLERAIEWLRDEGAVGEAREPALQGAGSADSTGRESSSSL